MPASGIKAAAHTARRRRAAAALIEGRTIQDIAQAEGVERHTISADLKTPEARLQMASLIEQHRALVEETYSISLQRVRAGLDATVAIVVREEIDADGRTRRVYEERPDHRNRLDAVRRFTELMRLTTETAKDAAPAGVSNPLEGLTWAHVQQMYFEEETRKKRLVANFGPPNGKT